jgi:hypothetical protein
MAWPTLTMQSWEYFDALCTYLCPSPEVKRLFFRGQADASWPLRSSLARRLPGGSATVDEIDKLQQLALSQFINKFKDAAKDDRAFFSKPPNSAIEWLGVMQHYRVPTTLLDWSFSPYIAAYFAVTDHEDTDGAVWFFDESLVEGVLNMPMYAKAARNKTSTLDQSLMRYRSIRDIHPNPRMEAQRGLFTWHRDSNKDFDVFIDESLVNVRARTIDPRIQYERDGKPMHTYQEQYGKIIIPAALKLEMFRALYEKKDISARTVYTGVDGLGQSLAEFIKLYVAKQPTPNSAPIKMATDVVQADEVVRMSPR